MLTRSRLGPLGPLALLLPLVLLAPAAVVGQDQSYVKANYTKFEYRIPMRDGVKLFTAVYVPKDESRSHPILLTRTPYGVAPYGADSYPESIGPSPLFSREGYIFAYQDVREKFQSEGEFVNVRPHRPVKGDPSEIDESTDAYDTIDWLLKNIPNNNGKVGQWGVSYPGFYTSMGMIDAHPALKASSPQAPIADWFAGDDWRHNGAVFLAHSFNYWTWFGRPRPEFIKKYLREPYEYAKTDGYDFFLNLGPLSNVNARHFKDDVSFWNEMMSHSNYDDFWSARNIRPHLRNIKPAVLNVGGWYDAENLFGALETYKTVEKENPKTTNLLVMGPWNHGGWARGDGASLGPIAFGSNTSEHYREQIEFPFFQYYLKGKGAPDFPEAQVFETGTNRWRSFDAWPPREAKPRSLHLAAGGRVTFAPPDASPAPGYDEYISDPSKPVGFTEQISGRMPADYMTQDQRFASRRPDVLTYSTDVLEEDLTLVGPIQAKLFVSTSGTDSDWIVKLIDVFPDDQPGEAIGGAPLANLQTLVRAEVMRGRFRNGLSNPEPFTPDQPTTVAFALPDVAHTFRSGHKLMIQIQSTWFPLIDRNPQSFVDIAAAKEEDFQKATQRVFRSQEMPSRLEVMELPR